MWKDRNAADRKAESAGVAGRRPKLGPAIHIWAERLLFLSGVAFLAIYGAARIESFISSRAALARFDALAVPAAIANTDGEKTGVVDQDSSSYEIDFTHWDKHRVQAFAESQPAKFDAPLGVLRISKIRLEVPLLEGTDDLTLNHAVGRIAGTAWPGARGNIGIAGHRDGFFRGLKDVGVGDVIELQTLDGTETYVVDHVRIVAPDNVSVLQPRPVPSLTLVTCYPFYFIGDAPQRYIVTASLTEETKNGSGNSGSPSVISKPQFTKEKQ